MINLFLHGRESRVVLLHESSHLHVSASLPESRYFLVRLIKTLRMAKAAVSKTVNAAGVRVFALSKTRLVPELCKIWRGYPSFFQFPIKIREL